MVSPELLRRYPFFAGLSMDQITTLAKAGDELTVDAGHFFFHEGDKLEHVYLAVEGAVAIVMELPAGDVMHTVSEQLLREMETTDVVVSEVATGEVFGWSGLVAPYEATAGAKATEDCRVVAFDAEQLLPQFEADCDLGYAVCQKVAQVIRQRLTDSRLESLADLVA